MRDPGTRKMVKMIVMIVMVKMKWCHEAQIGAPLPRAGGQDYVSSNKLPQISRGFVCRAPVRTTSVGACVPESTSDEIYF